MRAFIRTNLVISALVATLLAGCQAQDACERQYDSTGERRACMIGADELAHKIIRDSANVPNAAQASVACQNACGNRYNPDKIAVGTDARYFDELNDMTNLFVACKQACIVMIGYERDQRSSVRGPQDAGAGGYPGGISGGCEQIQIGGSVRCY